MCVGKKDRAIGAWGGWFINWRVGLWILIIWYHKQHLWHNLLSSPTVYVSNSHNGSPLPTPNPSYGLLMDRTCLCSAADAPSDAGISHGRSSSLVTDAFHPRHLTNSPSQRNKVGKQVKQFEFPIISNVCQHMVPISAVWTCVCDTMWMFWVVLGCFLFSIRLLLSYRLLCPCSFSISFSSSFLSRPLILRLALCLAEPTSLMLEFKKCTPLPPPPLSPSILVLLFLATSQTSGRPRGLFPKRSSGVDSRECYTHSHKTHTHTAFTCSF